MSLSFLDRSDNATPVATGNTKFERRYRQQQQALRFDDSSDEDDVIDLSQNQQEDDADVEERLMDINAIAKMEADLLKGRKLLDELRRKRAAPPPPTPPTAVKANSIQQPPPAKKPKVVPESTDEEGVIDLSASGEAAPGGSNRPFHLGGGYCVGIDAVQYKGVEGINSSYDVLKLERMVEGEDKRKQAVNIHLPTKLIPTILVALSTIDEKISRSSPLNTVEDVRSYVQQCSNNGAIDVSSSVANTVPAINFKLDSSFNLKGETLDWGKTSYDVLSFVRNPKSSSKKKDAKATKPFVFSLPGKYFKIFYLTLQYLAHEKGYVCKS